MELLFAPLFSGSSGNCIYVGTEDCAVLVDAGMSATAILNEMKAASLRPSAVKGILVTHEHTDHVNGAGVLARKLRVPIYATEGTWEGMTHVIDRHGNHRDYIGKLEPGMRRVIETGSDFYIDRMNISPFPIPHDCNAPCGYAFCLEGMRAAVSTDIGCVKDSWTEVVNGSQLVLLESNYDPDMLMAGPYPFHLKRRIMGKKGHLSNEDSASAAVGLINGGARRIILGHLSKENNFPELALGTNADVLRKNGILPGRDVMVDAARRDGLTGVYRISAGSGTERII